MKMPTDDPQSGELENNSTKYIRRNIMKKFFASITVLMLIFSCSISLFAAGNNFVPSISEKPAPEIVEFDEDGTKYVGKIVDSNGSTIKKIPVGYILITPIAEIDASTELSDEIKNELKTAYAALTAEGADLSKICSVLNSIVAEKLGSGKNANNLVIRDFFDVTVIGDEYKALLATEGNKLVVDLKVSVDAGAFVATTVYVNGEWKLVDAVNNGDKTITCSFDSVCPVALFVEGTGGSDNPPPTGIGYENFTWIMLAIVSLAAIVVLVKVIVSKHNNKTVA